MDTRCGRVFVPLVLAFTLMAAVAAMQRSTVRRRPDPGTCGSIDVVYRKPPVPSSRTSAAVALVDTPYSFELGVETVAGFALAVLTFVIARAAIAHGHFSV